MEDALGAECGRLGAHAEFRPEPGQKGDLGERLDGLAIGLKPQRLIGEVIEDVDAKPVRQPRGVDDETYGGASKGLALHHGEKFIPLAICHTDESERGTKPAN